MKQKTITKSLLLLGTALTGLFVSLNHSSSVSAYSLTVSTSGSVTANVMPSADGGIGTTVVTDNVNIISNCRAGYTMTIAGPSDNNLYLNGDSTNNASGTYFSPVNGTSALNNSANVNKWGYSLTANSGTGVFSPLSSTPTTLKTPSQTASPDSDIDTTIPVYYGTAVNTSMAPGSYTFANSTSITYAVTMEPSCTTFLVQYQDNGADNPNGMGTTDTTTGEKSVKQINIAEDTKIALLAPNFKKAGYAFLGWSTDQNAYAHFADNDNTNDPVIYGPMEDVVIDADIIITANSRNQINMYAVWMPALKNGNSTVYFQDWDNPNTTLPHDGCSTLTATVFDDTITDEKGKITINKNSIVALTDKRDNMVYAIARLADGNCWMTENLRLDNQYTMGQNQNDPTVTNQYLSQGYGGTTGVYGNFVGLADSESVFINAAPNSVYKASSYDPVDTYDPLNGTLEDIGLDSSNSSQIERFPRYNNDNTHDLIDNPVYIQNYSDPENPSDTNINYRTNSNIYSYGNYYTWASAIANTRNFTSGSSKLSTSICPSGWRLPSNEDLTAFSQAHNVQSDSQHFSAIISNRFRLFPTNFVLAGSLGHDAKNNRGIYGYYWNGISSTAVSAFGLQIGYSYFYSLTSYGTKSNAMSIRCLTGISDVEITLNSNNGTGAISRIYGTPGSSISLPSFSTAEQYYSFTNWNTNPNGSGSTYTSNYVIPIDSTGETLYAQWTLQYKIKYINNCMSWASNDDNCTTTNNIKTSTQIILQDRFGIVRGTLGANNKFTMTGWRIKEWTTNADGSGATYLTSSTYTVTNINPGDGLTLYAHWVPIYSIQYDGNGSDNDNTGMGSTDANTGLKSVRHTNVVEGNTFDLFASNFKKNGYGFIGWSTDADAWNKLTDNDPTNDIKIWGPNELFTAPAYNGTPIITLYAIWVPAEKNNSSPIYLQNWSGCSTMTATTYDSSTGTLIVAKNSITALTDQRDNEVYAVAKLADNNCWVIENLRLDNNHELSSSNTNILTTNSSLPISNSYNSDSSLVIQSNYLSPSSSQNQIDDPNYGWCYDDSTPLCTDYSRLNTDNTTQNTTPIINHSITFSGMHYDFNINNYAYGNYYNWYSATAGYGTYNKNVGNTNGDLCPTGWHLPYGGTETTEPIIGGKSGGFSYLDKQMGGSGYVGNSISASNKWRSFPNNFVYSGNYGSHGGSTVYGSSLGGYGYYWSSSAEKHGWAYQLRFSYDRVDLGLSLEESFGESIRCVSY